MMEAARSAISAQEFERLCEDIYADRWQVYPLIPSASRSDALKWMLLGCLVNLLSVPQLEAPHVRHGRSADPYGDAICELMKGRASPVFDPRAYLVELSRRAEAEGRGLNG
ncbi:MAG TPA: hypothetical protein VF723_12010 [Pyrinomonadaceae bacterium]|jgi:hypothetical protein